MTFAIATEQFLDGWTRQFKRERYGREWESSLRTHAFPVLGHKPIDEITTGEVMSVLSPIWYTTPAMANRVRQRMEKIFDWAIVQNYREKANPAGKSILTVLPKRPPVEHMKSLPYHDVPDALRVVELSTSLPLTRLAFRFMVLTAARSGEARLADWAEIDWEQRTWTIPAERMKMGREHRVPLSEQALDTLRDAARVVHIHHRKQRENADDGDNADTGLIFHTSTGGEITSAALSPYVAAGELRIRTPRIPLIFPWLVRRERSCPGSRGGQPVSRAGRQRRRISISPHGPAGAKARGHAGPGRTTAPPGRWAGTKRHRKSPRLTFWRRRTSRGAQGGGRKECWKP